MQAGVPSDIQGIIESCDRAMSQAEDMCNLIPGQAVIDALVEPELAAA